MKHGKAAKLLAVLLTTLGILSGCSQAIPLGESAQQVQSEIKMERNSYLSLKGQVTEQDISHVISFVDSLEKVVGDLGEYTTSYDANANTVYVQTENANIACKLDDSGYVQFASASGALETKTKLNRGIVTALVSSSLSGKSQNVFDMIEQTKWLNALNAKVIEAEIGKSFDLPELNTDMTDVETPIFDGLTATASAMEYEQREQSNGEITVTDQGVSGSMMFRMLCTPPALTDTLEESGINDLSSYYEIPTLTKFWSDAPDETMENPLDDSGALDSFSTMKPGKEEQNDNTSETSEHKDAWTDTSSAADKLIAGMKGKIDSILNAGAALSEKYEDVTLENPGKEIPKWSLSSVTLPEQFSDGTSTDIGKQTADAYNTFYTELDAWKDTLIAAEIAAQKAGLESMIADGENGNVTIKHQIEENDHKLTSEANSNCANTDKKTLAAKENVDAFQNANKNNVEEAYESGKAETSQFEDSFSGDYGAIKELAAQALNQQYDILDDMIQMDMDYTNTKNQNSSLQNDSNSLADRFDLTLDVTKPKYEGSSFELQDGLLEAMEEVSGSDQAGSSINRNNINPETGKLELSNVDKLLIAQAMEELENSGQIEKKDSVFLTGDPESDYFNTWSK